MPGLRFLRSHRWLAGRPARPRAGCRLIFEALEARTLLSAAPVAAPIIHPTPVADPIYFGADDYPGSATPYGLNPNQVRAAYGLGTYTNGVLSNGINFNGVPGDGRGQTIAIVDYYDDPNALFDLNAFSAYYGLPTFGGSGPTFSQLTVSGQPVSRNPASSNYVPTDPNGPVITTDGDDWEGEESLDIEWSHAMAPMANIILYEATASQYLEAGVQQAASTPGVVAVSMSWGSPENEINTENGIYTESYCDAHVYVTPAGHLGGIDPLSGVNLPGGVTFLASAGDSGAYNDGTSTIMPQYPACLPNVLAVGGTSLSVSGSSASNYAWSSEVAWGNGTSSGTDGHGGGGGGTSLYLSQPSYQTGVVAKYNSAISTSYRDYPDISAEANPAYGVALYDSWDDGSNTPWLYGQEGGTSLASPLMAGMIAVADEGREVAGQGSLNGLTQTLPALYKMPAADFHDITYQSSGPSNDYNTYPGPSIGPSPEYSPGTGYDLATGLGSPVGNLLIPQLTGPSIVMPATAEVGSSSTSLSVLGGDFGGESGLTYTWSVSGPSSPTFSGNGLNSAKNMSVVLTQTGTYTFTVTITDSVGLPATSSVTVTVSSPQIVFDVTSAPFTATATDAAGDPLSSQTAAPWSLDDSGDVDFNSAAGATVNLDGVSPSFADVTFSAGNYMLSQADAGGTLQLDDAAGPSTLAVAAGSDTIAAPLAIGSDVTLLPAAGSQLAISGGISGPGGLELDAPGTVVLSGPCSYTGDTTVAAGTLAVTSPSVMTGSTGLTVEAGGAMIFDTTFAVAASESAATASATPVVAAEAAVVSGATSAAVSNVAAAPASNAAAATAIPAAQPLAAVAAPLPAADHGRPMRDLDKSALAGVLTSSAANRTAAATVPESMFREPGAAQHALATYFAESAAPPQWLQDISGSDPMNQQRKDVALQALDAAFAQYRQ